MMIRAIAIYQINEITSPVTFDPTIHHVPANAYTRYPTLTFWQEPDYLLKDMENNSLSRLDMSDLALVKPIHFPGKHEHHYFKKIANEPFVMVICSKSKLDGIEAYYLFANIQHAVLRPHSSGVTLAKMIANPLDYTGKDHLIENSLQQIDQLREQGLHLIDQMLERGENLDNLRAVTVELSQASLRFKREAEKQNSYCSYC